MKEKLIKMIDNNNQKYIDFLERICTFEGRAKDKIQIDKMMDYAEEFALSEGFSVTRIPFEKCGDFLIIEINENEEKAYSMMAHMDTVHDIGLFGNPAVRIQGDKMTGPGVFDCKGGAVVALLAMKALKEAGLKKRIGLLLTTDEEISNILGGDKEMQIIRDFASGYKGVLNCESGRDGTLVVQRSGILRMEVAVKGIGGHSGVAYFNSANAILEASHKIIELESKSERGGTTYNCSLIKGGTVANNIADNCSFTVDIRVKTIGDMKIAEQFVRETAQKCHVKGTLSEVSIVSSRPPMERNEDTMNLFSDLKEVYEELGFGNLEAVSTAGGADCAYTQLAGVPSICSMGPVGGAGHTTDEYIMLPTVSERAKLIAVFCLEKSEVR